MEWLLQERSEISILWLVLAALVGGFISGGIRFLFEDVGRSKLVSRNETAQIVRRYTAPLVRSAASLEDRIAIVLRMAGRDWFATSEYFRLSTLYIFGSFLGWVRIIEARFGFLPYETTRWGRRFNARLYGPFSGLTSHRYFEHMDKDPEEIADSGIHRFMLTAIGEVMISPDGQTVRGFTDFIEEYGKNPQMRRYFEDLATFLDKPTRTSRPLSWDRLIITGAHLTLLMRFLDPRGVLVSERPREYVEWAADERVRSELKKALAA